MNEQGKLRKPRRAKGADVLNAEFWAKAKIVAPQEPRSVHLKIDPDVFDFFKRQGKGHLTKMQAVLRAYVNAHRPSRSP